MTLSNTQSSILAQAGLHPSGLAIPPDRFPPGPRASIARALLATGFVARAAQGWTLIEEFSDIASGKDDRRAGFQVALARCRQLGAMLVAARLDRITRRAHTLSQLLEDGYSVRAAAMPGADDLMMRIYAAMAQKERELISERTRAALAAAKAKAKAPGRRAGRGSRASAATGAQRGCCDCCPRGRGGSYCALRSR